MNPLVELWRSPVVTLTALAYAFTLLGVSLQLAGRGWNVYLWLSSAYDNRHRADTPNVSTQWEYVPPMEVWNRLMWLSLIIAAEALLIAGILFILSNPARVGL